jgi:RNA polymerase-binding protein DksA
MKKSDLEKFKKLLLEKRRAMVEEMSGFNTRFDETLKERTGDLSSHSYHMADQGTDAMEREMAAMISSKSGRLVYHIDKALERIEKGEYGKCFNCGKQISIPRLEAVPHASFCIDCKSEEEKKKERRKK